MRKICLVALTAMLASGSVFAQPKTGRDTGPAPTSNIQRPSRAPDAPLNSGSYTPAANRTDQGEGIVPEGVPKVIESINFDKDDLIKLINDHQFQMSVQSLLDRKLEWLNLVVSSLTALIALGSAYLILRQIKDSNRVTKSENARLKKEFAVRLIDRWTDELKKETFAVVRLVKALSKEQCQDLIRSDLKPSYLDATDKMMSLVQMAFEEKFDNFNVHTLIKDEKIEIAERFRFHIRFTMASYLNLIESILSAWDLSVADRGMIELQFKWLGKGQENDLKTYRDARMKSQDDEMPSLSRFVAHLERGCRRASR